MSDDGSDFAVLRGETKGLESVFDASFSFLRFAVNGDDMFDITFLHMQLKEIRASRRRAGCGAVTSALIKL